MPGKGRRIDLGPAGEEDIAGARKGKKTFKRYLKSEHTDTWTDRQTNRLIESIGPEGRCFEKKEDMLGGWKENRYRSIYAGEKKAKICQEKNRYAIEKEGHYKPGETKANIYAREWKANI